MHSQIKVRSAATMTLLFLFALGSLSIGGLVAASFDSRSAKNNIDEYIVLLRENVPAQRAQITGAMLQLTPEESKKFWPVYAEFLASINKLNDSRMQNLTAYAANYGQMSDEQMDRVMKQELNLRKQRDELLTQYYEKFKPVGAETAARFLLVESQLENIADLQLDSMLPTGQ
jgi:hypothetical protein